MFTKNLIPTTRRIQRNLADDGIDRRGFLEYMAWAGTGVLWTVGGGVLRSQQAARDTPSRGPGLTFAQISDSHIGFAQAANQDVAGTLQVAVNRINALPVPPAFVLDISPYWEAKRRAIECYASQFLTGRPSESPTFIDRLRDQAAYWGWSIGTNYGEPFASREPVGLASLRDLL